jgi:poly(A) polymerase
VVRRLRDEGYESLWAGGCVRDQLLGKSPKDYDVASTATPDDVIRIFGRRRTVAVGASFGVVMVLGPDKAAGQIEVATFRSDGEYLDGRRPSSVSFCRPEEDAHRRDFTINGMFFDPLEEKFIDYVGGLDDLAAGIVRAIGDPAARFTEDKLRMLRAVRFTATFGFQLDAATAAAVRQLRHEICQVSEERVTQELKRMLAHVSRELSFRLLHESGLLAEILPEIFGSEMHRSSRLFVGS